MSSDTKAGASLPPRVHPLVDTFRLSLRFAPAPFLALIGHGVFGGLVAPLSVVAQRGVFDGGLSVARGEMAFGSLVPWLVLLAASLLLPGLLQTLRWSVLVPEYELRIRINVRGFLMKKCFRMKYEHFESPEKVETIDKVYNSAENTLRHMAGIYVPLIVGSLVTVAGLSRFLVQAAWWLPLTVVAPFMLNEFLVGGYFTKVYETMWKNYRFLRLAEVLGRYMRAREFVKEMKVFGTFQWMNREHISRLHGYNLLYEREYVKNMSVAALVYLFLDLCRVANVAALLALLLRGRLSVGLFVALTGQIFGLYIGFGIPGFRLHKYIFTHYYKLLGFSEEREGTIATVPSAPHVEFRSVRFRYPGADRYAVDGVSINIAPCEKLSLVGPNGAGKSTLIKLLLGLYEPESGEVLVNGHNVLSYTREARASLFAPVFQDFVRYSLTLRESLALGSPALAVDDEALRVAGEKGGLTATVRRLGWDRLIGKEFSGGTDLSGGEWQRLALSRAFLGEQPVVLLDEPTSQLDPMAEAELYRQFAGLVDGKTALFVTHRLGSTKITDRILVLEHGRIVEEGSHAALLARGGVYATMFEAQRQWYGEKSKQ